MSRFTNIRVEGFQSHPDTSIDLTINGVTAITGVSNSGKTSILRAMRWVLYNEPQGKGFLRVGHNRARVTLTRDDDIRIVRERTPSRNCYIIQWPDPDTPDTTFEGFGAEVPEEIRALTGVHHFAVDDLKLRPHYAGQLEGPFLGQDALTAPARAKILGAMAGVEVLDRAQRSVQTDRHHVQRDVKQTEATIDKLRQHIDDLDFLDEEDIKLTRAKKLRDSIRYAIERLTALRTARDKRNELLAEYTRCSAEHTRLRDNLTILPDIEGIKKDLERLGQLHYFHQTYRSTKKYREQRAEQYDALSYSWRQWLEILEDCTERFARLQQLRSMEKRYNETCNLAEKAHDQYAAIPDLERAAYACTRMTHKLRELQSLTQQMQEHQEKAEERNSLWRRIDEAGKQHADFAERQEEVRQQYVDLLTEAQKCPFCGSTVADREQVIALLN